MKTAFLLGLSICCTSLAANEVALESNTTAPFSQGWMDDFRSGELNCAGPAEYPYEWRQAGYGSNINFLLLAWANARAKGNSDVAVIVNKDTLFARTACYVASGGVEARGGWHCIFSDMPHLCAFDTKQDWDIYNQQHGLLQTKHYSAFKRSTYIALKEEMKTVYPTLEPGNNGIVDILAKLYDYINSYLQPWFKADVQALLDQPDIAAARKGNYVGMHIRRTDKQVFDRAKFVPTEKYFQNAAEYLENAAGGLRATNISGLWLSTDEEAVFDEAKSLAPKYFPNIKPEAIVFVTGRVPVRSMVTGGSIEGTADRNTYEAMVLLRLELQMLADADVFSGTFSSNLGRVVFLMRHTLNKPKQSALSGDAPAWRPGRRQ